MSDNVIILLIADEETVKNIKKKWDGNLAEFCYLTGPRLRKTFTKHRREKPLQQGPKER